MSAAKKATKDTTITEPTVVENDAVEDDVVETSPAKLEVEAEGDGAPELLKFTVEVGGESIELEGRWTRDTPPGALMFMGGNETVGRKYVGPLTEQIIGEDQIMKILDAGGDAEEMASVIHAWRKARGLGNG